MTERNAILFGDRDKLPSRRQGVSLPLRHRWPPLSGSPDEWFQLQYSRNPKTEKIAEMFLNPDMAKDHARADLYHDVATIISIALQYGAPLGVLAGAVGHGEVNQAGVVEDWPSSPVGTVLRALVSEG